MCLLQFPIVGAKLQGTRSLPCSLDDRLLRGNVDTVRPRKGVHERQIAHSREILEGSSEILSQRYVGHILETPREEDKHGMQTSVLRKSYRINRDVLAQWNGASRSKVQ